MPDETPPIAENEAPKVVEPAQDAPPTKKVEWWRKRSKEAK